MKTLNPKQYVVAAGATLAEVEMLASCLAVECVAIVHLATVDDASLLRLRRLKSIAQVTHVVAIASGLSAAVRKRLSQAGASACLDQGLSLNELERAAHEFLFSCWGNCFAQSTVHPALQGAHPVQLTARQGEVLKLMSQGLANKVIAAELGITERTVKIHVSQIFRELKVSNRTQAVLRVMQVS